MKGINEVKRQKINTKKNVVFQQSIKSIRFHSKNMAFSFANFFTWLFINLSRKKSIFTAFFHPATDFHFFFVH